MAPRMSTTRGLRVDDLMYKIFKATGGNKAPKQANHFRFWLRRQFCRIGKHDGDQRPCFYCSLT